MKKGDVRRGQLIDTAERLFYTKGYEKTSVQDILDELHFSKGGFYHHFDSKLSLLEALCETRAAETCEQAKEWLSDAKCSAADKLNGIFHASTLWQNGNTGFVTLLIGVAYREDGALMRERMKSCQLTGMQELVEQVVAEGCQNGEFWSTDIAGTAEILLRLYTQFTDEVAFMLAGETQTDGLGEKLTRKLWIYRNAIERILIAPLGSIMLFDAAELTSLAEKLVNDRLLREAGDAHPDN